MSTFDAKLFITIVKGNVAVSDTAIFNDIFNNGLQKSLPKDF
jgi:hypothetical protein